jgi:hypothetical protein
MQQTLSDSDHEDFANEDTFTRDDFKPTSFGLVTEDDIAMDMDSVVEYFEDDDCLNAICFRMIMTV